MMLTKWKQFIYSPMNRELFQALESELDKVWRYDIRLWDSWPGGIVRGLYLKDNYKPVVKFDHLKQFVSVDVVRKDSNDRVKDIIIQQWGRI